MEDLVTEIYGPMLSSDVDIIYEVTLPSGMVITNPWGFGGGSLSPAIASRITIGDDGRVTAEVSGELRPTERTEASTSQD
jgi:hypothetical protein